MSAVVIVGILLGSYFSDTSKIDQVQVEKNKKDKKEIYSHVGEELIVDNETLTIISVEFDEHNPMNSNYKLSNGEVISVTLLVDYK